MIKSLETSSDIHYQKRNVYMLYIFVHFENNGIFISFSSEYTVSNEIQSKNKNMYRDDSRHIWKTSLEAIKEMQIAFLFQLILLFINYPNLLTK